MRDSRNQIAEVDDFVPTPLTDLQRASVRRLVCAYAVGDTHAERVADARDLMGALGLLPSQENELAELWASVGRADGFRY